MTRSIKRRSVLGGVLGAGLLPSPRRAHARQGPVPASAPPNIVWIVCHDLNARLLGCYGNDLRPSSAIDALAGSGVLYENAFCCVPVCAPSRFSLVTGLHPETCGPAQNMAEPAILPGQLGTLPELMRKAGYYCTNNVFTGYNIARGCYAP